MNRPKCGPYKKRPLEERFWEKVDRRGPDECWPWKAFIDKRTGYGDFSINGRSEWATKQRPFCAHVVAYRLTHKNWNPDLCVLHHCDNRPCCNPKHLFQGTTQDNTHDKLMKGRQPRGETNGGVKLTEDAVKAIRKEWADGGITQRALARKYGVSTTCIHWVTYRDTWQHVS